MRPAIESGADTAHVGRQYLGSIGKIDNGVVSVHTLWANEERYYPIEVEPYSLHPGSLLVRTRVPQQTANRAELMNAASAFPSAPSRTASTGRKTIEEIPYVRLVARMVAPDSGSGSGSRLVA